MRTLYFACMMILFLALQAFAQEEWLGKIVVKGDSYFSGAEKRITQDKIHESSSYNIAEAVSNLSPRLTIQLESNRESMFKLRGFDQRHIVVMLDGVPVYVPYTGTIDLGKFAIEDVGFIAIAPSLPSVLYGPNALGGAVNIETKRPREPLSLNMWSEFGGYQSYVTGQTLSFSQDKVYGRISSQLSDTNAYRLSGNFENQLNQGAGRRSNSDKKANAFSLLFGYSPSQNYEYAFRYSYLRQEYGIPPSTIAIRPKYWRFRKWEKETYSILNKLMLNDNLRIRSTIFYDTYFNILDAYDDGTYATQVGSRAFRSTYDDYSYGANIILNYGISDDLDLDWLFTTKYDRHNSQGDFNERWSLFSAWTHAIGFESRRKITDGPVLMFGGLYEYFDPKEADGAEKKPAIGSINPQVGVSFDITGSSQAYLKIGRRSRFPTLKELYSDRSGDYRPNPGLKEEEALHYNLGYTYKFANKNTFQINLFRSDVKGLIDRVVDTTGVYQYQMQNISKVVLQGFEIDSTLKFFDEKLEVGPFFQYLYSENKSESRATSKLPYRPRYKLGADIKWQPVEDLFIYWRVAYISNQYYENVNLKNDWQAQGGYAKVDLKFEKKFDDKASAWVRVDNLLDKNYEGERGFPMPGRGLFVGFRLNFN